MCGIIGYVGKKKALPVLIGGLERLAYRGYDSSGVACVEKTDGHKIITVKEKGKIDVLKKSLEKIEGGITSTCGIGHTRWATHGEPSTRNAHPHLDGSGTIALVHNGIIENYSELKKILVHEGHKFLSETDTEVAVRLVQKYYRGDIAEALTKAVKRMEGFFAFVVASSHEPDRLVAFKRANPLVVGVGKDEHFFASDAPAILPYTRKVIYLEDEELAVIERKKAEVVNLKTKKRARKKVHQIRWSIEQAEKGGYPHFMLKEIYEQPDVLRYTLQKRVRNSAIHFDTINEKVIKKLKAIERIFIVSCGTAFHAGLAARYMLEEHTRIPTEVQVSSEFRYTDPILSKKDMVIFISQSGETADTLAALREAKSKGAYTLGVINVVGSTISREADSVIYTHAGPEIGVASTKAYLAQLSTMSLFALYLGSLRGTIKKPALQYYIKEARKLPHAVHKILEDMRSINKCAKDLFRKINFIYLARGYSYPNALEGALKFKEITYTHAHGYAAGEMKHGPIALVDKNLPVVCIVPRSSETYEKMLSNIEEVKARKGIVISVATEGDTEVKKHSDYFLPVSDTPEIFTPILTVVPLQLLAYKVAVLNKRDVDQPRNLAKSVTVE